MKTLPPFFHINEDVSSALANNSPVVALESTVITHGLPQPDNLSLARDMEKEVRENGALPATIGLMDGKIMIGLTAKEIETLAYAKNPRKISRRDFGIAIARKENGGTTVAGTLIAAHSAGIKVFATGGIGGVHRNSPFDVSADLPELGRTPLVVVCAGAKAILDLPATLEYLETTGVPVVGYQTDSFPAFYSTDSGLPVNVRANTPEEVAQIANAQWKLGLTNAILVCVPPPADEAIPPEAVEGAIQQALAEADAKNIRGSKVTPFMLLRVSELTHGTSLKANIALLRNNARVAAQIARALSYPTGVSQI